MYKPTITNQIIQRKLKKSVHTHAISIQYSTRTTILLHALLLCTYDFLHFTNQTGQRQVQQLALNVFFTESHSVSGQISHQGMLHG
jgi:hypothetical protein